MNIIVGEGLGLFLKAPKTFTFIQMESNGRDLTKKKCQNTVNGYIYCVITKLKMYVK